MIEKIGKVNFVETRKRIFCLIIFNNQISSISWQKIAADDGDDDDDDDDDGDDGVNRNDGKSDNDDVGDRNVLKKSLSTVDIANEIMKEIGSKVNFCEDGSILTNDSDARDQYYNTFFSKLMRPFINLQRLKEAIGFPDWFPIQQKAKLFRS